MASVLGGMTTQPVGRPAPGPAAGGNTAEFLRWAATPAGQQWGAGQNRQLALGPGGGGGYGIGRNGGIEWVGQGPEPTDPAARQAGIDALTRGTLMERDAAGNPTGAAFTRASGLGGAGGIPSGASPQYGVSGFENAVNAGLGNATGYINAGMTGARGDINTATGKAVGALDPYAQSGVSANNLQADLSGANGPEAQRAAFAAFNESPDQAYQREMGMKAVTQNAAALGGLHGSNVMRELQRVGTGLAAQDYSNYFNRAGTVADRGASASGQVAGIYGDQGNALAGITTGGNQALADYNMRAGEGIATTRYDAGNRMSDNIGAVTSAISNLTAEQGRELSRILGVSGDKLAALVSGAGEGNAASTQELLKLLSNVDMTSAQTAFGISGVPGIDSSAGQIGNIGNFLGGVGSFAASPAGKATGRVFGG